MIFKSTWAQVYFTDEEATRTHLNGNPGPVEYRCAPWKVAPTLIVFKARFYCAAASIEGVGPWIETASVNMAEIGRN